VQVVQGRIELLFGFEIVNRQVIVGIGCAAHTAVYFSQVEVGVIVFGMLFHQPFHNQAGGGDIVDRQVGAAQIEMNVGIVSEDVGAALQNADRFFVAAGPKNRPVPDRP
jgi:hypothetical protein